MRRRERAIRASITVGLPRPAGLVLWAALLAGSFATGCAPGFSPAPAAVSQGGNGAYSIGRLTFEVPMTWSVQGDARHVQLSSEGLDVRVEVQRIDRVFKSDAACWAQAQEALARGAARFTNVRRHTTSLAGKKAIVQEADQESWHGWAWALCEAGEQYRLSFAARAPMSAGTIEAMRRFTAKARFPAVTTRAKR